jgi:hypothetical protein
MAEPHHRDQQQVDTFGDQRVDVAHLLGRVVVGATHRQALDAPAMDPRLLLHAGQQRMPPGV